jgi:hypothetical protein
VEIWSWANGESCSLCFNITPCQVWTFLDHERMSNLNCKVLGWLNIGKTFWIFERIKWVRPLRPSGPWERCPTCWSPHPMGWVPHYLPCSPPVCGSAPQQAEGVLGPIAWEPHSFRLHQADQHSSSIGNHTVFYYTRQFNTVAQYGLYHVDTDEKKANLYHEGLTITPHVTVLLIFP